jgi:hypothetical protein
MSASLIEHTPSAYDYPLYQIRLSNVYWRDDKTSDGDHRIDSRRTP